MRTYPQPRRVYSLHGMRRAGIRDAGAELGLVPIGHGSLSSIEHKLLELSNEPGQKEATRG